MFLFVFPPPSLDLCSGCLVLVVSGPTHYTSKRVHSWRSLHTSQPKAYIDASWQNAFLQSVNFTPAASMTCDDGDIAWKVKVCTEACSKLHQFISQVCSFILNCHVCLSSSNAHLTHVRSTKPNSPLRLTMSLYSVCVYSCAFRQGCQQEGLYG